MSRIHRAMKVSHRKKQFNSSRDYHLQDHPKNYFFLNTSLPETVQSFSNHVFYRKDIDPRPLEWLCCMRQARKSLEWNMEHHSVSYRCSYNLLGAGKCPFQPGNFDPHTGVGFNKHILETKSGRRIATYAAKWPPTEFPTTWTFKGMPSTLAVDLSFSSVGIMTRSMKSIICSHHLYKTQKERNVTTENFSSKFP